MSKKASISRADGRVPLCKPAEAGNHSAQDRDRSLGLTHEAWRLRSQERGAKATVPADLCLQLNFQDDSGFLSAYQQRPCGPSIVGWLNLALSSPI